MQRFRFDPRATCAAITRRFPLWRGRIPVAITVNGKEDTVVMSHESFMEQQNYIAEMEARLQVYAHLAQAEDDVKLGRVQPIEDVRRNLLRELDDWAP